MSMRVGLKIACGSWPLKKPLRFAFAELASIDVLTVELDDGSHQGRGEGIGVFFRDDTPEAGARELAAFADGFVSREVAYDALKHLASYAARNALDCALWDLRCKQEGKSVWSMIGANKAPVATFETISLDSPSVMASAALAVAGDRLKLKVDAARIVDQVQAVREARPDAILLADANQDMTIAQLEASGPALARAGLALLEQPLPAGKDSALRDYTSPVPLCADESCFTANDVGAVAGLYDAVNIKLDKAGGLTGGLALLREARRLKLKTLVGCMAGTSLSMAPALALASLCDFADLDGPLLLADDYGGGAQYRNGVAHPPSSAFWG